MGQQPNNDVTPSARTSTPAKRGQRLAVLGLSMALLVAGRLGAPLWWGFELTTHFTAHYAVVLVACVIGLAITKRTISLSVCAVALLICLIDILPLYLPNHGTPVKSKPLCILSANVLSSNQAHDRFLALIKAEDPDIIMVTECNPTWAKALAPLKETYPYSLVDADTGNFGIALFSRVKSYSLTLKRHMPFAINSIVMECTWAAERIRIIATHPVPPTSAFNAKARNDQLSDLETLIQGRPMPTIIAGDFNCTTYSPTLYRFTQRLGLSDARQGIGIMPTWFDPITPFLGIPIDLLFHSPEFYVVDHSRGPAIGSDHRPLITRIMWRHRDP